MEQEDGEDKLIVDARVAPKAGPPFHVHFVQDECLEVIEGKLGYQILGEEEKFLGPGERVVFRRGQMHRFWNAGEKTLVGTGWIRPANSVEYFLTGIYNSMTKAGKPEGDPFDSAYLITRYRSEYDLAVIPGFVKKIIMPITVVIGKLLGKYSHFKDAPEPIK
jgi:mannose-6-phosphate isomerase-like protein (cupin superfamily)